MRWTPRLDSISVSHLSAEEAIRRLSFFTQSSNSLYINSDAVFHGETHSTTGEFGLFLKISTPQNALPVISGKIESTSHGSIIFLKARLFPAGKLYLRASSGLCVILALIFLFLTKLYVAAIAAAVIGLLNYAVLTINFHKRTWNTIKKIEDILSATE